MKKMSRILGFGLALFLLQIMLISTFSAAASEPVAYLSDSNIYLTEARVERELRIETYGGMDYILQPVSWESSDEQVAQIVMLSNNRIMVRAQSAGNATIRAEFDIWYDNGSSLGSPSEASPSEATPSEATSSEATKHFVLECDVTVRVGIEIDISEQIITNRNIRRRGYFENYTDQEVVWTVENERIVEFYDSYYGSIFVKPLHNGSTVITAATVDGRYSVSFRVVIDMPIEDDFYYNDNGNGSVTITGYGGTQDEVLIPDHLLGKRVSSIANYAFSDAQFRKVIFSDGITSTGYGAFSECSNLEEVILGSGVTKIDTASFAGCENLNRIEMGENITYIGSYAFAECIRLAGIKLPDSLEAIGAGAFKWSFSIEEFIIPKNVMEIDFYYYSDYLTESNKITNLSNLNIPVEQIGNMDYAEPGTGWYTQELGGEEIGIIAPGATVYRQYPVRYSYIDDHINGNNIGNPNRYNTYKEVTLKPLKDYIDGTYIYRFDGWYTDRTFSEKVERIERGTRGTIELYAKQIVEVYQPTKRSSGGSSGGGSRSVAVKTVDSYAAVTNPIAVLTDQSIMDNGTWKLNELGQWQYVNQQGVAVSNQWVMASGNRYLIGADGLMITGWQKVNNQWYLFSLEGSLITGWKYVNNQWYYLDDSGVMKTGWIVINEQHYYLDLSGILFTSTTTPDGYQVDSNGVWIS